MRANKGLKHTYMTPSKEQVKELYKASKLRDRFCTSPLMLILSFFFFVLIVMISFIVRQQNSEYWDVAAFSDALYQSEGTSLPNLLQVTTPQLFFSFTSNKYKSLIASSDSAAFKIFRLGIHQIRYDRSVCPRGCTQCCLTYRDFQGQIFINGSTTNTADYELGYSDSIDSLSYKIRGAFNTYKA